MAKGTSNEQEEEEGDVAEASALYGLILDEVEVAIAAANAELIVAKPVTGASPAPVGESAQVFASHLFGEKSFRNKPGTSAMTLLLMALGLILGMTIAAAALGLSLQGLAFGVDDFLATRARELAVTAEGVFLPYLEKPWAPVLAILPDMSVGYAALGLGIFVLWAVLLMTTGGLLHRQLKIYIAAFRVFGSYQWLKRSARWRQHLSAEQENVLWDRLHDANAHFVLDRIRQLRGFWVKIGQFLSSRGDVMPPEWIAALSSLQDELPADSIRDILTAVERELGDPAQSFAFFDHTPLASASIAQVDLLIHGQASFYADSLP